MYKTRKEAAKACEYEGNIAIRYSESAVRFAQNGECNKAWGLADTARMAAKCAMQAHEALWNLAGKNMTEAERAAFEKAEAGINAARKAESAAAAAVRKASNK